MGIWESEMMKAVVAGLLFSFVGPAFSAEIVAAGSSEYAILDQLDKVTRVPAGDLVIKVFEKSGGDPAMNGNVVLLGIAGDSRDGESFVWDTGIDMLDIESIRRGPSQTLLIEGQEHYLDEDGRVHQRPVRYELAYEVSEGRIANRIQVVKVD